MSLYLAEFVGTMILIFFGVGVNASVNLNKSYSKNAGWLTITFGWGLGVMLGVYAVGNISGAHLNPAVTIAMASIGDLNWSLVPGYIIAQVLGAIMGSVLVYLVYSPHWRETNEDKLGIFATGPAIDNKPRNILSEMIGTFFLVLGILTINANELSAGIGPFAISLLIVALGVSAGGATGYAINPARDLGPRIAYSFLPVGGKKDPNWGYAIVPIVGPILGGVLGAFVFTAIF
ncbi:MIP/aquaporin family protein [Microaceticoccus formicicus]|uniref:MIP/aquaporin family protein n=1 Tax=Microaceticoccus formicicus TaxID=3118105 RepID=UPI003CCFFBB7|nr:MIP/aquaporin family protein [Peptoniphilaceae bacterium AMB_02]